MANFFKNRVPNLHFPFHPYPSTAAKMLEARILQGSVLKKIIESIRELVVDANFDCDPNGISMQVKAPATITCALALVLPVI